MTVKLNNTGDPNAEFLVSNFQFLSSNLRPNGDVNLDGQLTPADALMTFRYFLGLTEMSSGQRFDADVTEDGHITPGDALCIFRAFLRLPSCMD